MNTKTDYKCKFEFSCVFIVILLIGLVASWSRNTKLESEMRRLESSITSIESQSYDDGYDSGINGGYHDGYHEGYDDGLSVGDSSGYETGYDDGYLYGYAFGIKAGINHADEDMDPFTLEFLLALTESESHWRPID